MAALVKEHLPWTGEVVALSRLEIHPNQRCQPACMWTFAGGSDYTLILVCIVNHYVRPIFFCCGDDPVPDVPTVGGTGG